MSQPSNGQIQSRNHAIDYARALVKEGRPVDAALATAYATYGIGRAAKVARLTPEEFEQLAFPQSDFGCP